MYSQPNLGESRALPKRSRLPLLIPLGVGVCMIAITSWSAWPILRPARTIEIEQAIIVQTSQSEGQDQALETEPDLVQSTRMVQAAGWLEAEPYFVAATALTDGVIEELLVLEGDRVDKSQTLAKSTLLAD